MKGERAYVWEIAGTGTGNIFIVGHTLLYFDRSQSWTASQPVPCG
jgi:hypothetical protein